MNLSKNDRMNIESCSTMQIIRDDRYNDPETDLPMFGIVGVNGFDDFGKFDGLGEPMTGEEAEEILGKMKANGLHVPYPFRIKGRGVYCWNKSDYRKICNDFTWLRLRVNDDNEESVIGYSFV